LTPKKAVAMDDRRKDKEVEEQIKLNNKRAKKLSIKNDCEC
jgi:hypothetical protein